MWCLHIPRRPWPKPELGEEKTPGEQPPAVTMGSGWPCGDQHLPVPLLKDKNPWQRSKVRPGRALVSSTTTSHAHSPPLLMPGEETHIPRNAGGFTLLPVGDEVKLQLVLVPR